MSRVSVRATFIVIPPLVEIIPVVVALAPTAAPLRSTPTTAPGTPATAITGRATVVGVLLTLGAAIRVTPAVAVPITPAPIFTPSITAEGRARWRPTRREILFAVPAPIT